MRYTFKRSPEGALTDLLELPEGHEVVENVHGQVSIRRERPRLITVEEESVLRSGLRKLGLDRYQVEAKEKVLTVFEPDRGSAAMVERFASTFGLPAGIAGKFEPMARKQFGDAAIEDYFERRKRGLQEQLEQMTNYDPVMQFTLIDEGSREFRVARMTYLGRGGWHDLDRMTLAEAADRYLPHLGQESFFDLH